MHAMPPLRDMTDPTAQLVQDGEVTEQYIVYMDGHGQRHRINEFDLTQTKSWISAQTFQKFGICWKLTAPSRDIDITIQSVCDNQEFETWMRMPSFYEGAFRFSGIWEGVPIRGFGTMEIVNEIPSYDKFMEETLSNASALVRAEIERAVPPLVCPGHFKNITGVKFDNTEEKVLQQSIVDAFHLLNNRGGKNWLVQNTLLRKIMFTN